MKGMGRIFKRGSVWWVAYYHRGEEIRESSNSDREVQAKRLLRKRLGEMGRGKLIGPSEEKVTFDEIAEMLRQDYKVNARKAAKAITYPIKHLENTFGLDRALDITTDRIVCVRGNFPLFLSYCFLTFWGRSSVGRALESHSRGRGFDPHRLHQFANGAGNHPAPFFCAFR
jgi:hypothetical protein